MINRRSGLAQAAERCKPAVKHAEEMRLHFV